MAQTLKSLFAKQCFCMKQLRKDCIFVNDFIVYVLNFFQTKYNICLAQTLKSLFTHDTIMASNDVPIKHVSDDLAKDFCDNDEFWKGVTKLNQCNNIQANSFAQNKHLIFPVV